MKVVVVYPLLATAIILFLSLSPSPSPRKNRNNLSLHRRVGNNHAPFDPLVTKLIDGVSPENNSDSKPFAVDQASVNPFSGVFEDEEEYFSEEGQFNIKARLQILFPLLDNSPEDGKISLKELEVWNLQQANNQLISRTQKEIKDHDKNGDGAITFAEYQPLLANEDIDKNDMTHGQAGWWMEKFNSADIDSNGILNFKEFMDFLHPEDSENEKLQRWKLKEKMQGMDHDKDGKLNFKEFRTQAYEIYKSTAEFESGGDDLPSPEEKFDELDVNKDRLLTEEELRPIVHYLHPGEFNYAKHYTKYLIHEADDDNDGKLSLKEMLDNDHIFYNTVITENDVDDDDDFHDEF
ncbi:Calumenin-b [Thalictrum thalictroides]|uniref:Calumenin-b n=1 Tax=Thalictrum thalictroides TaxID=46969 RepID=A0A7J6X5N3_THATH|nr:Calumenin-b [Thalictrum thalictroides]